MTTQWGNNPKDYTNTMSNKTTGRHWCSEDCPCHKPQDECGALIQATVMGDITCNNDKPCKTHAQPKECCELCRRRSDLVPIYAVGEPVKYMNIFTECHGNCSCHHPSPISQLEEEIVKELKQ